MGGASNTPAIREQVTPAERTPVEATSGPQSHRRPALRIVKGVEPIDLEKERARLGLPEHTPTHLVMAALGLNTINGVRMSVADAMKCTTQPTSSQPTDLDTIVLPAHLERSVNKGTLSREEALGYMGHRSN